MKVVQCGIISLKIPLSVVHAVNPSDLIFVGVMIGICHWTLPSAF
jgi:hypothetical protein